MSEAITEQLHFRYPWRPYQARVLEAIDMHLSDSKLHVVAAPGSGKTTLGLEVFRRLGKPCLVLSPTRIIRNQWVQRLVDYVPEGESVDALDWVSLELDRPAFFTSITYQALHTRYRQLENDTSDADEEEQSAVSAAPNRKEVADIVSIIRGAGIGTLVLDEAHHLRSEWWRALNQVVEEIPGLHLVSLTATPPYDVVGGEWAKYQQLCGPIDEEISVPELVQAGTLAPHQDFCYLVRPAEKSRKKLHEYEQRVEKIIADIGSDPRFDACISAHPWLHTEGVDTALLLDNIELVVGLLVYLKARQRRLPWRLLAALELETAEVPQLDRRWWNVLVKAVLFHPSFTGNEEQESYRAELAKRLRADRLLNRRDLQLHGSRSIRHSLSLAPEKIVACVKVHRLERQVRGESLRQVILTDYIREESGLELDQPSATLGAWPVFKSLLAGAEDDELDSLALLTGRLTLIHKSHRQALSNTIEKASFQPVDCHEEFLRVDADSQQLTRFMTDMIQRGNIRVLVGTRALLGEGWDCPAINSLVLASAVGSFMTTNQMRGRAIRVDKNDPAKVASIWHLVALEKDLKCGLSDYESLAERHRTFVGLHHDKPRIESGIKRLSFPVTRALEDASYPFQMAMNNREMASRLKRIDKVRSRWQKSLESADEHRVIPSVGTADATQFKSLHFKNTLKWALLEALLAFLTTASWFLVVHFKTTDKRILLFVLGAIFFVGFIRALPKAFRAVFMWIRHFPVDGSIKQIGLALRDAMCEAGVIAFDIHRVGVTCVEQGGRWYLQLTGANFYEQSLFADSLNEVLGQIANPRYLITRRKGHKVDYHAVPEILGTHKKKAMIFWRAWNRRVADGELVYTRNPEGRASLLKARSKAFSAEFVKKTERLDRWQ